MNGTLWRDDAKIAQLARLPWSVRTSRCEISGEYLAWVPELPGTCAATTDAGRLPDLLKKSIASNIRVRLYMGDRLQLPVSEVTDLRRLGWSEGELAELWSATARPDRALEN